MIFRAARDHGIDLARSFMIGDAPRDVEAGRAAGVRNAILLGKDAADLKGAADLIRLSG